MYLLWTVTIIFNNFDTLTCSCSTSFTQYCCKLLIWLENRLKLISVSSTVKSVALGL